MTATPVWCLLVDHDKKPAGRFFMVDDPGKYVVHLKRAVKEQKPRATKNADADDFVVWRCKDRSTVLTCQNFEDEVRMVFFNEGAEVLDERHTMAELGVSATETLLVQIPLTISPSNSDDSGISASSSSSSNDSTGSFARIDDSTVRRSKTVHALLKRLNHYKFILVRGTPASGKSTLAELLSRHICDQEPDVELIKISNWSQNDEAWEPRLKRYKYKPNGPNTIIFDEAQLTYWDTNLWNNLFKSTPGTSNTRIILFASYGSPAGQTSIQGTPMVVSDVLQIGLRPVNDHVDKLPAPGLFLTADEFTEMFRKNYSMEHFAEDFRDYVYYATAGHAGAVGDLLHVILGHDSYRELKVNNGQYTLEIFRSQLPINDLWSNLQLTGIFSRGLPPLGELQRPEIARIFRTVLTNNYVTMQMLDQEDHEFLWGCFKHGWLYAARSLHGIPAKTEYIFSTPLHQWFVEYHLGTSATPDLTGIEDLTLLEFAVKVVQSFSYQQLSSPRNVGASDTQRPPEAQYQDEFYRCCFEHSKKSFISFPEFGDASGRVDFYIPCNQWGVELLCDGDRLESHASRFTGSGKYAHMTFSDYIILDFRKNRRQKKHPGISKLYHVVFSSDYRNVQLLAGSSLDEIAVFELLN